MRRWLLSMLCLIGLAQAQSPIFFNTNYSLTAPTAATPTFSPAAGTYDNTQTVTISSGSGCASYIYWTTSGCSPTTGSTHSTSATVSANNTVCAKVIGCPGFVDSAVGSAAYSMIVATPTFSPVGGAYSDTQTVTINDGTTGATGCYTTNGSDPAASTPGTCSAGTTYTAPVSVASSSTIKSLWTKAGYTNSSIGSAAYTLTAATPTFSPAAGTYTGTQNVTISTTTGSSVICYTTNGVDPAATTPGTCSTGTTYSSAVSVAASETVKAIATRSGITNSAVGSAAYTINTPTPQTVGKTTTTGTNNGFTDGDTKAVIRFAFNGSGSFTKVTFYVQAATFSPHARAVIYAADGGGGAPGTLLATSNEVQFTTTGWVDLPFPSPVSISSTTYLWIGLISDSLTQGVYEVVGDVFDKNADTYAGGASNPFGTPTESYGLTYGIYATYTP